MSEKRASVTVKNILIKLGITGLNILFEFQNVININIVPIKVF